MTTQLDALLKSLLLKDLRIQCRARGINPGGSREALMERVRAHMLETGNHELVAEYNGEVAQVPHAAAPREEGPMGQIGVKNNNYSREQGQNVGNFITDRPSSRVLAPPGGVTSWSFGGDGPAEAPSRGRGRSPMKPAAAPAAPAPAAAAEEVGEGADGSLRGEPTGGNNNYSRPSGQNQGNFLTDKPSSRVLAPPGGGSSIVFG